MLRICISWFVCRITTYDLGSLCARNTDRRTDLETAFRGDFFLSGFICRCFAWLRIWKCCGSASSIAVCAKLLLRPIEEILSCEDPCCAVWLNYGSEIGVAMHPVWRFMRSFWFLTRFFHGVAEHGGFRNNASIISLRASQAVLSARIFLTSKFIYLLFSNYNWDCK